LSNLISIFSRKAEVIRENTSMRDI
jgi:hypothetical protein